MQIRREYHFNTSLIASAREIGAAELIVSRRWETVQIAWEGAKH